MWKVINEREKNIWWTKEISVKKRYIEWTKKCNNPKLPDGMKLSTMPGTEIVLIMDYRL